jgi:hypothetical protein
MRRTRGALAGDGGGTGRLGGDAPGPSGVRRNDATCDTVGVALKDFESARSTPGPATDSAGRSGQQLVQVALRRGSDKPSDEAVVGAVAADAFDTGEP